MQLFFLEVPYGRACFYFFVGTLLMAKVGVTKSLPPSSGPAPPPPDFIHVLSLLGVQGDVVDVAVGGFICAVGTVIFASSFKIGQALKTLRQQVDTTAHRSSLTPSQSTVSRAPLMQRRKAFGRGRGHLLSHVSRPLVRFPPLFSSPTCACTRQEYTREELSALFQQHDADGSGALDTAELAALCASLGTTLSAVELESALLLLDVDGDGTIRSLSVLYGLRCEYQRLSDPNHPAHSVDLAWPDAAVRTSFWRGGMAAARCRTPCAAATWTGSPASATRSGDHFVGVLGDGGKPLIARV